jgi:DNA-binding response OmpR family regulator
VSLVLYVEDDPLLHLEGRWALQEAGYEVISASSGQEAYDCLRDEAGRVATLITDIGLCGAIGGWDVADLARTITLRLPVIYVTGADADQFAARGVPGSLLVAKPFDWDDVLGSVVKLLVVSERVRSIVSSEE